MAFFVSIFRQTLKFKGIKWGIDNTSHMLSSIKQGDNSYMGSIL